MSALEKVATAPLHDVRAYAAGSERWLAAPPDGLRAATAPLPNYADRVSAMAAMMRDLHDAGWSRYGWPEESGGLGGTILHRAVLYEELASAGFPPRFVYEHLEVLFPALL